MYFCRSLTGYAFGPSPFGKAGVFFLHCTVQPGFGSERMTGVPSVRNCQKPPPGPIEPKPDGSWEDPVLAVAKADPIRQQKPLSENSDRRWRGSQKTAVHSKHSSCGSLWRTADYGRHLMLQQGDSVRSAPTEEEGATEITWDELIPVPYALNC